MISGESVTAPVKVNPPVAHRHAFGSEQPDLARDLRARRRAVESTDAPIARDHPMAWDVRRARIAAQRLAYRTVRVRAKRVREIAICGDAPTRYVAEFLVHRTVERRDIVRYPHTSSHLNHQARARVDARNPARRTPSYTFWRHR